MSCVDRSWLDWFCAASDQKWLCSGGARPSERRSLPTPNRSPAPRKPLQPTTSSSRSRLLSAAEPDSPPRPKDRGPAAPAPKVQSATSRFFRDLSGRVENRRIGIAATRSKQNASFWSPVDFLTPADTATRDVHVASTGQSFLTTCSGDNFSMRKTGGLHKRRIWMRSPARA